MTIENAKELTECLCCGGENLTLTLDLGQQPMANSFLATVDEEELTFPLKLNLCRDCFHLQLSHAVNPDLLFKNYLYVSGTSKTLKDYFDWFANVAIGYCPNEPKTVLDIACNDGTQLNSFKAQGLTTYGIDPATNLHPLSSANHEVVCDYFTRDHVDHCKSKHLDIIVAQNVLAHNSYPLEFLLQCKEIMHDDTVLFVQTSQVDMVKNNEFDTVYHEHLSFFCANSMQTLARRAGLNLIDIRKTPIHGNSYMFVFSKTQEPSNRVLAVLNEERDAGLQSPATYVEYKKHCDTVLQNLKEALAEYRVNYTIVGYGAAAKGMTLINAGDLYLDFVIDDNPLKQGKYCPGSRIPVVSVDQLEKYANEKILFVPLAWNFFDEIKKNIKNKRNKDSDLFIRYFPSIRVE
jgi:2-polyprenyl-3-methyl-5-hydroxy-6-metoxy-1,4-benzoquinol methylase